MQAAARGAVLTDGLSTLAVFFRLWQLSRQVLMWVHFLIYSPSLKFPSSEV